MSNKLTFVPIDEYSISSLQRLLAEEHAAHCESIARATSAITELAELANRFVDRYAAHVPGFTIQDDVDAARIDAVMSRWNTHGRD